MLNVLITGAASGIGKATLEYFIENKHNVFAVDINEITDTRFKSFKCDITNKEDLKNVYNYLSSYDIKLDAIINIAGIHMMASLVESDYDLMKKVIDINLCGTMLVNKTFYPLLKETGRVIIVTSEVATYDPMPFNGLYNISKTALDSYTQALRQELNLKGIKVITIRPGSVETPLSKGSLTGTKELVSNTVIYENESKHFLNLVNKFMGKPLKPVVLGKLIYKVTLKKHPKYIYNKHRSLGLVLLNMFPKRLQCGIIKALLKRK